MNPTKYLTLEYRNRGRTMAGIDCWGLCCLVYKDELGITLSNLDGYTDSEDKTQVEKVITCESKNWVKVTEPQELDIVVFKFADKPNHVGIMLSRDSFLHALAKRGINVERISNILYRNRVENYYRYAP